MSKSPDKKTDGIVRWDVPLARYTTFRIGGPASCFAEPQTLDEIQQACDILRRHTDWPVYVLGGGSNLLIRDEGVEGAVICMRRFERRYLRRFGNLMRVGSGVPLAKIVNAAAENGLSGLEPLAGIPGTVGGALSMNAGAREVSIGDLVTAVEVIDSRGRIERIAGKDVPWRYRSADFGGRILLFAELEFRSAAPMEVRRKMTAAFEKKRASQPLSLPSAGCFFKNPTGDAAGRLVDVAGLKGAKVGGAAVSSKHANFIVNRGGATAADVFGLVRNIRESIRKLFDVELEAEVCVWP